jgi:HEAT repeat protein
MVIPALMEALGDRTSQVRQIAARSLGKFGPEAAVAMPTVLEMLKEHNSYISSAASEALAAIGSATIPALAGLLHHQQ